MKKLIFTFCFMALNSGSIFAQLQQLIAVQNGNIPSLYTSIDSAIVSAQNGDTLFLPGGVFSINGSINKKIHIIGVGHNPEMTKSTNYTYLSGNNYPANSIYLSTDASGGSMTGVLITGSIYMGNYEGCVNNYKIWRCKIGNIGSEVSYTWSCSPSNISIIECIVNYISFPGASNLFISNNIIEGLSGIGSNNVVRNNIFLTSGYSLSVGYASISSSNFENNIFIGTQLVYYYSNTFFNNVFNNNLFVENVTFPYLDSNVGVNNIVNQSVESIFINQNGNSFSYEHDYHLKTDSPGKNAGRDGTDIGIYGGVYSWKEGSIPFNPHFQQVQVAPKTDANGNLNVNIKVEAQER